MWVRTWLTEGTLLLLLHITERQSGMCPYKQWQPKAFLTKDPEMTCMSWLSGCILHMSMRWTTWGISWRRKMNWWKQSSYCLKLFPFSMLSSIKVHTNDTSFNRFQLPVENFVFFFKSVQTWFCRSLDESGYRSEQPAEVWGSGEELLERHPLPEKIPRLLL